MMEISYEFILTESCTEDMKYYRKNRMLSEKDFDRIIYQARLEAENFTHFKRYYKSERIKGIEDYHIRKLRVGIWRLLLLIKENVTVFYGIALWNRKDAYKEFNKEKLLQRVKVLAVTS